MYSRITHYCECSKSITLPMSMGVSHSTTVFLVDRTQRRCLHVTTVVTINKIQVGVLICTAYFFSISSTSGRSRSLLIANRRRDHASYQERDLWRSCKHASWMIANSSNVHHVTCSFLFLLLSIGCISLAR